MYCGNNGHNSVNDGVMQASGVKSWYRKSIGMLCSKESVEEEDERARVKLLYMQEATALPFPSVTVDLKGKRKSQVVVTYESCW